MICKIVEWYLIFFNINIYFYHVFPQCQYIDLKLLFRRWFGMHMKCAKTFSSFKVYNNIICTVVQTLFVLYTLLHYLVYVTLYIRIFICVFPYTFGFNHNSKITKPPLKVHKIKGAKDFTVAQVLYIYAILVIYISRVQCIYNEKKPFNSLSIYYY